MILVIEYSEQLKSYLNKYAIKNYDYSQFQNIKTIGKGAYATVYSATFQEEVYALKSLDNNLGLDEREFNQLQRELKLLYATKHSNVVEFYGISQ
ncbi:12521_t:CDS:2, partial [Cetraspora pellucida]